MSSMIKYEQRQFTVVKTKTSMSNKRLKIESVVQLV